MDNKTKAIEFLNITFGYTNKVNNLIDVTFDIYENEYICIVGHNGSGKSTLSKILIGLLQPKSGKIKLFGEQINKNNIKYLRDNIGIVFQNPDNQFIGLTSEDDIAFGLENRKVDPSRMRDIILAAARMVDVQDFLEFEASKLSGGQKQRVAIASVLATNPKIIIFDESTSMLDPRSKRELKKLMIVLKNDFHKTIISITHDMEEVTNADRVIIMNDGKLSKIGAPKEIFENREFLQTISLDIPFSLQLSKSLIENNVNIQPSLYSEDLVTQI
jgi:energy-coupling factor transport system ATP-binding protein